jgi:hypothetical protein
LTVALFAALEATRGFGLITRSLFRLGSGVGGGHGPHIPLHRHLFFLLVAVAFAIAALAFIRFLRGYGSRLFRLLGPRR